MIVLGIDPGTIKLGYGIICVKNSKFETLCSGTVATKANVKIHKRLGIILNKLSDIIKIYSPTVIALEKSFYHKNVRTTIALGEARGVVLSLAGKYNLNLKEFSPTSVKQSIGGSGRTDKDRLQKMVKLLLNFDKDFTDDNESDALAIALCCIYRHKTNAVLTSYMK